MRNYEIATRVAAEKRALVAQQRAEHYRWFMAPLVEKGLSLGAITRTINAYPIQTPSGNGQWSKGMVRRTLDRLRLKTQIAA